MTSETLEQCENIDQIIWEIIELERSYFFDKQNVRTERRRKLRELVERHTRREIGEDGS